MYYSVTYKESQSHHNQYKSTTKIELPLSFVTYANLKRGGELSLLMKSNSFMETSTIPNVFSGHLQINEVSSD